MGGAFKVMILNLQFEMGHLKILRSQKIITAIPNFKGSTPMWTEESAQCSYSGSVNLGETQDLHGNCHFFLNE